MPQHTRNVTETEFAILNVLWERGLTTVREIVEAALSAHIELLPGIELILHGNKQDVKRMTDLIRQIEQRGLKPQNS